MIPVSSIQKSICNFVVFTGAFFACSLSTLTIYEPPLCYWRTLSINGADQWPPPSRRAERRALVPPSGHEQKQTHKVPTVCFSETHRGNNLRLFAVRGSESISVLTWLLLTSSSLQATSYYFLIGCMIHPTPFWSLSLNFILEANSQETKIPINQWGFFSPLHFFPYTVFNHFCYNIIAFYTFLKSSSKYHLDKHLCIV